MTSITLYNSDETFTSKLAALVKTSATFTADFHELAYNALMQIKNHKNTTPLITMFDAIGNAKKKQVTNVNQRALKAWALAFGAVGWSTKNNKFTVAKKKKHNPQSATISPHEFVGKTKAPATPKTVAEKLELIIKFVEKQELSCSGDFTRAMATAIQHAPK